METLLFFIVKVNAAYNYYKIILLFKYLFRIHFSYSKTIGTFLKERLTEQEAYKLSYVHNCTIIRKWQEACDEHLYLPITGSSNSTLTYLFRLGKIETDTGHFESWATLPDGEQELAFSGKNRYF